MRYPLLFLFLLVFTGAATAQTQLDPGFLPQEIYQPAEYALQALQLSDGSRIVVSNSIGRVNGSDVYNGLIKLSPSGQLDAAFKRQVEQYSFVASSVAEAPGNKLIVELQGPGTFGSQVHNGLVRLNFDGSLDPSFRPQPALQNQAFFRIPYAVQPDGKIVVGNEMALNASSATRLLARLNTDGTPDASFSSQLSSVFSPLVSPATSEIVGILRQPDGKLLVSLAIYNTPNVGPRLIRLQPTGATDGSFSYPAAFRSPETMALQPDGKILISENIHSRPLLVRLQPSGLVDFSFITPTDLTLLSPDPTSAIQVQADGRVLVAGVREPGLFMGEANSFLVRLLSTGAPDTSWQPPMYGDYQAVIYRMQLLPSGQVLVAGTPKLYASATAVPSAVGLLDASGANVATFAPVLQNAGLITNMALQPDGRIVAGGKFSEINGVPARNLARFNSDGTLDASFTANCAVRGGSPYVSGLVLQADGKIIVGGGFAEAGGSARTAVARLLPSGLADPTFTSPLQPHSSASIQQANNLALQPDGQLVLSGYLQPTGAPQAQMLLRTSASGQVDTGFQPGAIAPNYDTSYWFPVLVQPDGRIVTANLTFPGTAPGTYERLERLLPSGSIDPAFTRTTTGGLANQAYILTLARYPDGRLLAGGNFGFYNGLTMGNMVRLSATGVLDASFVSTIGSFQVRAIAIQPNGRVLAAGDSYGYTVNPPMIRLLNDGSADATFIRAQGPALGLGPRKLLIQPDGKILLSGYFTTVAGQPRMAITRLLDANVLHVASAQTEALTSAWPVPTHGDLHLALDAAAYPQQVRLLDALGRTVLRQPTPAATLTLSTAALPAGTYLLRVDYRSGSVTRRVVVE
jgi:uncharacterized delta-60 repeat protein